jgi:hypothetical protein
MALTDHQSQAKAITLKPQTAELDTQGQQE